MLALGFLLVWILGYFLTWRMTAYVLIIPPLLLTFFLLFLPETPYWLIEHNNLEAAQKSLQFFRGNKYDITEELTEIQQRHDSKVIYKVVFTTVQLRFDL
jgi:MFS family permease